MEMELLPTHCVLSNWVDGCLLRVGASCWASLMDVTHEGEAFCLKKPIEVYSYFSNSAWLMSIV
jgi:hypothetical protein